MLLISFHVLIHSLLIIVIVIALLVVIIYVIAYIATIHPAPPSSIIPPDKTKVYHAPLSWKGVPIDSKNRYINYEHPFYQNYVDVVNWFPGNVINLIKNFNVVFQVKMVITNNFLLGGDIIIWLGHASFFLRLNGINILIDPQFHNTFPYARHSANPISAQMFTHIDYILLSHDHADHCDRRSIRLLIANNPEVTILAGLGMDNLVSSFTEIPVKVITAEWYEEYPLYKDNISIHFVPARHYCKRLFKPFNKNLWGGFVIKYQNEERKTKTIYFAGDSGYGTHFQDIGQVFNPQLAILGIGAYKPKWFMEPNHISPKEAIQAFEDTRASTMIPMHYGTFNLSNEGMKKPLQTLKDSFNQGNLKILIPGHILSI